MYKLNTFNTFNISNLYSSYWIVLHLQSVKHGILSKNSFHLDLPALIPALSSLILVQVASAVEKEVVKSKISGKIKIL